jgi:hypothetical protein
VPEECETADRLDLGRCELAAGGVCRGGVEDDGAFVAMGPGDAVAAVVGPQGSTMFVLAACGEGFDPGDVEQPSSRDNPLVEIILSNRDTAHVVSLYRGRAGFAPDPARPGRYCNADLFVIVDERPGEVTGHSYQADATVTDRTGKLLCGSLVFQSN